MKQISKKEAVEDAIACNLELEDGAITQAEYREEIAYLANLAGMNYNDLLKKAEL